MKMFTLITCAVLFTFFSCSKTPDQKTVLRYVRAQEAYSQGKFTETLETLSGEKKFPPALLLRVKAEFFSGDLDKAEKTCRRLLKIQPSFYEGKLYLARILREKGDSDKAVQVTESLLADYPQDIRALRFAAELASESKKYDEMEIFLDKAAELSAESALVLLDRARLRWVAGKGAEALEDLSRAKAMLPWDTPLLRPINNLEKTIKEVM
ncbi:tetratricopeptide repeat protein [Treponema sp. R6D11]